LSHGDGSHQAAGQKGTEGFDHAKPFECRKKSEVNDFIIQVVRGKSVAVVDFLFDVKSVCAECTTRPIRKVMFQCFTHGAKCQFIPGNLGFTEQLCFHRFMARVEHVAGQAGAVIQMHLAHSGHAHHGEQVFHDELRAGFFCGFSGSALRSGFTQFHEACRQGPFALARLDVAFAQQDLVAQPRHCDHHIERVFVVNRVEDCADGAVTGVAVIGLAPSNGAPHCRLCPMVQSNIVGALWVGSDSSLTISLQKKASRVLNRGGFVFGAPSMGAHLRAQVSLRAGHSELECCATA